MPNRQKNNVQLVVQDNAAKIVLNGDVLGHDSDDIVRQIQNISSDNIKNITFDAQALGMWDSSLLVVLYETLRMAQANSIKTDMSGLPKNLQDLMKLRLN